MHECYASCNRSEYANYELNDQLLKPQPAYPKNLYLKENSHNELVYTPIKLGQRRSGMEITPFSILKSPLVDSACIQTRCRKVQDSALPQEHWKLYSSNIKKPASGKTPFEEFFDVSGRKELEFRESDSESGGLTPFGASLLKKRPELDYSDVKQPKLFEPAPLDGLLNALNSKSNIKAVAAGSKPGEIQKTGGCNCEKSKCLQMYCDCFKNGGFCGPNCFCFNCENKNDNEKRKQKVIVAQKKNRSVFAGPEDTEGAAKQVATKGCNCRKSGCLKKYCECHQLGVACTDQCKCKDCKNNDCGAHKVAKSEANEERMEQNDAVKSAKRRLFAN